MAVCGALDLRRAGGVALEVAGRRGLIHQPVADVEVRLAGLIEVAGDAAEARGREFGVQIDEAAHVGVDTSAVDLDLGSEETGAAVLRIQLVLRLEEIEPWLGSRRRHPFAERLRIDPVGVGVRRDPFEVMDPALTVDPGLTVSGDGRRLPVVVIEDRKDQLLVIRILIEALELKYVRTWIGRSRPRKE